MASDKPKCDANAKRSTKCQLPAGWGTPHPGIGCCKLHGGCTPNQVKAAERKDLEQKARKAFGRLADVSAPIDDPLTALAHLAGHAVAWMEFLGDRIAELERLAYSGEAGEQITGEIVLFERALDRCNTVLGTMARLNIDQRLAKISEQQLEIVTAAIVASLSELGLSVEQQREARAGVVRHLRLVTG